MLGFFKSRSQPEISVRTLAPRDVHDLMSSTSIALIDVRERAEHENERIPGAINIPLSQLQAQSDRIPRDKTVILHCLSGGRSKTALDLCARMGVPVEGHMGGGITAWKAAGLPVKR
jgi:rhodanese-related sulfurtransferase